MKKLLLTLLLLLSLGFAASAAEVTETASLTSSTIGTDGVGTFFNGDIKITFDTSNSSYSQTSHIRVYANKAFTIEGTAENITIKKIVLTATTSTYNKNLSANVGTVSKSGSTATWTGSSNSVSLTNTETAQARYSAAEITYEKVEEGPAEKIDLEAANLIISDAEGNTYEDNASVELAANTELKFSYTTDVANADITISYTDDTEYTEGTSYTFTGENDVILTVKAASNNEVEKTIMISKKYPTVCPTPVFSVADGAEVHAGQVITVTADGAEELLLTANDADIEGTSYTVAGNPGDEIVLYALASVTGKEGAITAENTITVTVVEATEAMFRFKSVIVDGVEIAGNTYGLTPITDSSKYESDQASPVTEISSGIVKIAFEGAKYRYWSSDQTLRVQSGASFTISVPEGYYIESIDFGGTSASANPDYGTLNRGNWTNGGEMKSAVKFSPSATLKIETITIKYAKMPEPSIATSNIEIKHGKAAGVVTVNYTFEVANHNGGEFVVTAVIDGKEHIMFEEVPAAAAAPARAAGENTVVSGTLKAKHEDLQGATGLNIKVAATLDGNELYSNTHAVTTTTGIEDVTVDGNAAAEYFNLQGIRVAEPQAGQVYIVRRGATTTKELVK